MSLAARRGGPGLSAGHIDRPVRRMSLRQGFGWNFVGTTMYNAAQWALLVVLARLTDKSVVGQFSLTLAISAPVFLTVGLNMRTLQAIDAGRKWQMREYLSLRHVLNAIATVVTIVVALAIGLRGEALAVIAAMCLAKCVEAISQTYYGYFQKHERLDLVARSLILRSVTGPLLFTAGVFLGDSLLFGCLGLLAGWLIPQWLGDRPSARAVAVNTDTTLGHGERTDWPQVWSMAKTGSPLGIDAGLSSLAINLPRYAVQGVLGAASLGTYAALAYLAQTVQVITSSLSGALVARLAIYHHQGRRRDFVRLLLGLTAFSVGVMSLAVVGAWRLGGVFVTWTLGPEYVNQRLLVALMLSAGMIALQRALCKGLEASWRFRSYVVVDTVTTGTIAVLAPLLLMRWGLVGAAAALATGFAVGTLVVIGVLVGTVRAMPPSPTGVHDHAVDAEAVDDKFAVSGARSRLDHATGGVPSDF